MDQFDTPWTTHPIPNRSTTETLFIMSRPTFAVAVTFRIHADSVETFRNRVLQQARDSVEREPGCHQFDVLVDEKDPATIVLYETYTDAAAFDTHRTTDHFKDFDQTVTSWIETKEVRRLCLLES